jgi:hypothetical protein
MKRLFRLLPLALVLGMSDVRAEFLQMELSIFGMD